MAIVRQDLFGSPKSDVYVFLDYDPASLVIQDVGLANTASGTGFITLLDRTTGAVIFGPASRPFQPGVLIQNVASVGLLMLSVPGGKGGIAIVPPFIPQFSWTAA